MEKKNKITDFEIHYTNESKEGQNLRVYKKVKSNVIDFLIMKKKREIVKAKLLLNNINYLERKINY